ncbi:hypothetical protein [Paraburkholderia fungorum]|uniref:hypothetical protein n=1 Tax=Paraburkholderia fungorum TaxID=134537 RepID=UPI00241FA63D|nr:hypothetical protein [Paraburkholderia fungorum]
MHNLLEKQSPQMAARTKKRQMREVESGWTKLPIDPAKSLNLPQVTGAKRGVDRPFTVS